MPDKTIIFANGVPADPQSLSALRPLISAGDTIICANGGTHHALGLDLTPNLVVGDLDSLSTELRADLAARGVTFREHPARKDQTDLELALAVALERGAEEILLLTLLGGRLDQQLANLLLLTRPEWQGVRLWLADGRQAAWLLRGPDELRLTGRRGDTLSFIPLSPSVTGLTLQQVEWPLDAATVSFGTTLTISNAFTGPQAVVRLGAGIGLAVHIRR